LPEGSHSWETEAIAALDIHFNGSLPKTPPIALISLPDGTHSCETEAIATLDIHLNSSLPETPPIVLLSLPDGTHSCEIEAIAALDIYDSLPVSENSSIQLLSLPEESTSSETEAIAALDIYDSLPVSENSPIQLLSLPEESTSSETEAIATLEMKSQLPTSEEQIGPPVSTHVELSVKDTENFTPAEEVISEMQRLADRMAKAAEVLERATSLAFLNRSPEKSASQSSAVSDEPNDAASVSIATKGQTAEPAAAPVQASTANREIQAVPQEPALVSQAGVPAPTPEPPPKKSFNPYPVPKLLSVRHIEGINNQNEPVALATNYTTALMILAPDYRPGAFLPMADLRGHRFDDTTYAANAGFVGRFIPSSSSAFGDILGFNAFYDYRQGGVGYFQQLGLGLEVLGRRWEFRGNAYVPFGAKRRVRQCVFDDYEGDFFFIQDVIESVSYAFNAEVGYYLVNGSDFSLYLAAGPYYIAGDEFTDKKRGGEARIRPQYRDFLALDLSVRYDSIFKTIWQGEIAVNLPLYAIKNQNLRPSGLRDRQIYQPVQRFEVMPVTTRCCYQSNF
jgi:hypothetical protein